ncbi:phage tail assembly chaperone [Roseibium sp. RKSG952]|uniref:phage tail assembly chaperone n=1 Tax=Roseibium sp. RKSG952 TaxID=2529384 RepID=UPI0012BBDF29|nr:phage tail assembly chaperone [Roseibium sp. RKSG952]MTH95850.1 phage tail assembly chaperone [Roseibium sp. RKSG952]
MKSAVAPFPWRSLQHLAARQLGWTPQVFWAATPRELAAALGLERQAAPMERDRFDALRRAYPDT